MFFSSTTSTSTQWLVYTPSHEHAHSSHSHARTHLRSRNARPNRTHAQTLQTWQSLQEWAQRAWAKHYPNHVDDHVTRPEVAQVVKQVVGRQQTTIHSSGIEDRLDDVTTVHGPIPGYHHHHYHYEDPAHRIYGPSFVADDLFPPSTTVDPSWSSSKPSYHYHHHLPSQYETDIAFSSLQLPGGGYPVSTPGLPSSDLSDRKVGSPHPTSSGSPHRPCAAAAATSPHPPGRHRSS